jgi:hypothetical protein
MTGIGQLTVPTLETLGTTYVVRWAEGVTIRLDRLYQHRDYQVDAEVTISDEQELSPHLLGPVRTSITKTWRAVIADLDNVSERGDWRQRLTQATVLVLEAYRAGVPIVALGAMEKPPAIDQLLKGIVYRGLPSLVYGDGGIGKSQMALAWAQAIHTGTDMAGLPATQANALFLDWETSSTMTWHRSAGLLKAAGVEPGPWPDPDHPDSGRTGMCWYRFMSGPLWDSTEFLKSEVARLGIKLVVIDSAGPAAAGQPESAEFTLKLFNALRDISDPADPVSSIILAHVTHEARKGGKSSPFGSVFWSNLPRNTYSLEVSRGQGPNNRSSDYALHHRKSNVGNLNDPIGMRLSWGDNGCTIEPLDVRKHAKLRDGLNLVERVGIAISEHGAMSTGDLADLLDAPNRSLSATLSGDDRFVSVNGQWETAEPLGVE